ncbi:NPP1 family protein [Streptomyces sp. NPDC001185]|uniref:NPP1 family protein n=1 Tax=Streptomyces sp. NPDC001185 TaxID=3154380 RepID=UPI003327D51F
MTITRRTISLDAKARNWGTVFAALFASLAFLLTLSGPAQADVITALPQNADGLEQTFSPAYDYDGNGCYTTAAISPDGYVNPGLGLGGAVNGHCHDRAQLDHANTYSREKCNNGWCAIMYASYFEKDQSSDGVGEIAGGTNGHRHDWEHVVVWVQNNTVKYVSVSQHKGWATYGRSSIRFDPSGTHPKVVYHKDGGLTHDFRIANASDDNPVENVTGGWFYPRLVGWNGYPSVDFRNKFVYHTPFGAASIKIGTGVIEGQLAAAQGGIDTPIAFNAYA